MLALMGVLGGAAPDVQRADILRRYATPAEAAEVNRTIRAQTSADGVNGAGGPRQPVVITVSDSGECYARQVENWACTMRALAVRPFLIFALDDPTHAWLLARREPSVRVASVSSFGGAIGEFGTASYRQANFGKIYAVLIVLALNAGDDVLVIDVDVLLAEDPRPAIVSRALRESRDALFQLNYPTSELNGGFYLARNTEGTLRLMQTMADLGLRSAAKDGSPATDQDLLNGWLNSECAAGTERWVRRINRWDGKSPLLPPARIDVRTCRGFALSVATLDARLYRTGQPASLALPEPERAVLWHANFKVGGRRKHAVLLGAYGGRTLWCSPNRTLCGADAVVVKRRPEKQNLLFDRKLRQQAGRRRR